MFFLKNCFTTQRDVGIRHVVLKWFFVKKTGVSFAYKTCARSGDLK